MERPGIVLVSIGFYGQKYLAEAAGRDLGADIVGIVEVAPGLEERFPVIGERGWKVYPSLEAFYAERSAELAVISSPIHLHTEMAVYCMEHGSNVLCEKPLCLTREEALAMDECAKRCGTFLSIGYQLNYQRDVWELKKDILSGRFGKPKRIRVAHAMRRGKSYYARNNWAGRVAVNGREVFDSPFTNACAHNFQLMCFLLGDQMESACGIDRLEGELWRGNPNVENYDIAFLRFYTSGGVPILYHTAHPLKTKNVGPIGVMEFERAVVTYKPGQRYLAQLEGGEVIDYSAIPPTGLMQKLDDAIACVKGGPKPMCGIQAELSHIEAVRMVQSLEVKNVDTAHVDTLELDGDTFWCVQGLENVLLTSSQAWALPGEMGLTL